MAGSFGGRYSCWRTCRYSFCGRLPDIFPPGRLYGEKHRTRLHVLHITTADELALFDAAPTLEALRQKTITAEACVHHLFFNYDDYEMLGHKLKCNPSVKSSFHQEALWRGVNEGIIDVIATDHAPHLLEEKQNDYFAAPSGLPLVQHALPALLDMSSRGFLPRKWW